MAEADESGRISRVAEPYMGMSARDFFESVRSAAIDADSITRRIRAMESREGVRAQSYEPRGRSSGTGDAMRATDARMDFESRIERRREEDYRLIDAACSVIYGADQSTGGVGAILGAAYADALWWRFCAAATWPEVAGGRGDERAVVQGRRGRGDGRHRLLRARAHEQGARARGGVSISLDFLLTMGKQTFSIVCVR